MNMHVATGTLKVMDRTGHTKITWTRGNVEEVRIAHAMFDDMISKGHSAFRVSSGGGRGERITTFDPAAESIIMVAQLSGG
jgi:hypothetical protein